MQETKKAFRAIDKRKDVEGAVNALSNLKGVGPAMASGNHQRPSSKRFKGRIENDYTFDFSQHFCHREFVTHTSSTFDFFKNQKGLRCGDNFCLAGGVLFYFSVFCHV